MSHTSILAILLISISFNLNASNSFTQKLDLVGNSTFSVLFWDVYDISLYAKDGKYRAGQLPITIQLEYQRKIKSTVLVEETGKQWMRYEIDKKKKTQWLSELSRIWPDVYNKDKITFHIDENYATFFYHNQAYLGKIEDKEFSKLFSKIWLDVNGPYPKMTKRLIGIDRP